MFVRLIPTTSEIIVALASLKEVLLLFLGALIGLLGPPIAERIRRGYWKDEVKRSMFTEVRELRCNLAQIAYIAASYSGSANRQLLEWCENTMRASCESPEDLQAADNLKSLLALAPSQLQAALATPTNPSGFPKYKRYSLPFLTSQITSLLFFTPEFQRSALDMHARVSRLNEEIVMYPKNWTGE